MRIILSIILSLGFICSSAQQDTLSIFTGLLRKMKAEYDKGESRDKRLMLQYCDAALALSPGNKTLFLNCRIAALELGDTTLAVEYLRRAVNELPFESDLATSYGWHLLTHNMPDSAYYYCKRAYDLNRSSLAAVINYAHVLFLNNRQAAAKVIYAEAMDMVNTLEEYTENQEADFTTFAALYPAAGFNELRMEQRKKMEALLEQYKSANNLALQYAKLNNARSTTPQQLIAKINEALAAEEAMDEKRVKRISHYLCSRANMEYTYFSNVTGYLAGYKAAIPYLIWDSNDDEQGLRLRSIGTIYSNLGMSDSAFTYFKAAAKAFHSVGDDRQIAQTYLAVARLYVADNNNDQLTIVNDQEDVSSGVHTALGIAHGDVLPYFLRYNYNEGLVDAYEFIADCYIGHKRIRNLDSAVYYLQKAVYTSKMNLMPDDNLMAVYNDLASVEMRRGNYDKGREYLLKVDELIKAGSEEESSRNVNNLYNLGYYYFVTGKFDSAIFYCQRSVDLLFRIRKTLSNKEKMSLVSSQAGHFSLLGSAYFQEKNYDGILLSIEQCRTMVLADKMGADNIAFSTIAQIQAGMTKDQVYYITGFTDENRSPSRKLLLVIDKEHALAKILSDSSFVINSCKTSHGPYLDTIFTRFRKSNMEGDGPLKNKELNLCTLLFESKLASASGRSRGLEIQGGQQDDVASATDNTAQMGRLMYRELIQPFESMLKGKKEMIVLTDGFLNFMPFDALINEQGEYLADKLTISYLPSFRIGQFLKARELTYSGSGVVVIGNPVFKKLPTADMALGVRSGYAKANAVNWRELPGTIKEIEAIQALYKQNVTLSGDNCTEEKVKELFSKTGTQYKIVHFATHGYVMTGDADLSAVVLNQVPGSGEDGYLTVKEIGSLKIPASLVVLSACETGKGTLIEGEGVQGLASSFLLAGANSLIVSLWSVSDNSTQIFMQKMYEMVSVDKISFKEAVARVKRRFMAGEFGEEYKKPYYWAPFIYIGN